MKLQSKDGKIVDVPDDKVAEAYASGLFGLPTKGSFNVKLGTGEIGSIDAKDLPGVLDAGGGLATKEEVRRQKLEDKYGGLGGAAAATAEGIARGATVGLSDPIAVGIGKAFGKGEQVREHLSGAKEVHPGLAIGGELVGTAAPLLLPGAGEAAVARTGAEAATLAREGASLARAGEASTALVRVGAEAPAVARVAQEAAAVPKAPGVLSQAVRAAGMPVRGVSAVGDAAAAATRSILGEGTSLGRITAKTAQAAAEGGLFGVGQEISEDTLGNHELNAEKLLAAFGHGALIGSVAGAGLGTLGEAGGAALKKLSPTLQRQAEERAWKSLDPIKKYTKEAEAIAGGTKRVGRVLLEEDVIPREAGKAALTPEELAPRVNAAVDRVGQRIGEVVDTFGGKSSVSVEELGKRLHAVVNPLRSKAGFEPIVESLDHYLEALQTQLRPVATPVVDQAGKAIGMSVPFRSLMEQRQALQELAWNETKMLDAPIKVKARREMAAIMSRMEEEAIDRTVQGGGQAAKELRELKSRYQALKLAQEAVRDTSARMQTNRTFSLSDVMKGGSYGSAGLMAAAVSGHPMAAVGGLAAEFVRSMMAKAVRERGNPVAAVVLDKLAQYRLIREATTTVDKRLTEAVDGFFSKQKPKLRLRAFHGPKEEDRGSLKDRYAARVATVAALQAAPAIKAKDIEKRLGGMNTHAPNTVQAMVTTTNKAASYLAGKMPKGNVDPHSLTPHLEKPKISDADMAAFMRHAEAVDNPFAFLHDLQSGKLSRESVDAVRANYPNLYADVQKKVMDRLATMDSKPDYQQRIQLGILLDIPTDGSLDPVFIKAMQASYQSQPGGQGESGGPSPRKRSVLKMTAAKPTEAERIEAGGEP